MCFDFRVLSVRIDIRTDQTRNSKLDFGKLTKKPVSKTRKSKVSQQQQQQQQQQRTTRKEHQQQATLMSSFSDFRVHLIFSEGAGIVKIENRYEVYGIALFPFVLGVPSDRVDFTVNPVLIRDPDLLETSANEVTYRHLADADGSGWFPDGYHEYFKAVCLRSSEVTDIWKEKQCGIRIVTGRGLPRKKCGRLVCQGTDVLFQEFGHLQASILTIIDVCNSPFAVAALAGHYHNDDPATAGENPRKRWGRGLSKRFEFVDACTNATFACDNTDFTYAFRIAEDNGEVDIPEDGSSLSKPFGDAVVLSVLLAAHDLAANDDQSLDDLFKARFNAIETEHIGGEERDPASRLQVFEDLLRSRAVVVNEDALDCKLFRNSHLWYFTNARMTSSRFDPSLDDQAIVSATVSFVVGCLCLWHTMNPGRVESSDEQPRPMQAWTLLVELLGTKLRSVRLETNEENGGVEPCEDGTSIRVWACTCSDLPNILKQVKNMLASGGFLDDAEELESDYILEETEW